MLGQRLDDLEEAVAAVSALPGKCGCHSADSWAWGGGWGARPGPLQAPCSAAATHPCCPQPPHTPALLSPTLAAWQGCGPRPGECLASWRERSACHLTSLPQVGKCSWLGGCHLAPQVSAEASQPAPGLSTSPCQGACHTQVLSPDTCSPASPFPPPRLVLFKICNGKKTKPTTIPCENTAAPRPQGGSGTGLPLRGASVSSWGAGKEAGLPVSPTPAP